MDAVWANDSDDENMGRDYGAYMVLYYLFWDNGDNSLGEASRFNS